MRFTLKDMRRACAAFTLMEVNLAIFIMAVGVLAMVSLYPLGMRENQQSSDDVRAAALADLVLGQITAALSSRNITWDDWKDGIHNAVGKTPNGWRAYLKQKGDNYLPLMNPWTQVGSSVFDSLMAVNKDHGSATLKPGTAPDDLKCALVAQWGRRLVWRSGGAMEMLPDYSRVSVSFRATRNPGALFAQPLYYTEIHFQGDQKDTEP